MALEYRIAHRRAIAALAGLLLFQPLAAALAQEVISFTPNDLFYGEQYYLRAIKAPEAWLTTMGDPKVIVVVLDSGVDIDHPDLKDNVWTNRGEIPGDGVDNDRNGFTDDMHGWNFVELNADPRPVFERYSIPFLNHGTVIAGLIAARTDNAFGVAGVAGRTTILPVRVLDSSGRGSEDNVINGIDYAVAQGASIIVLSFAGTQNTPSLQAAVDRAWERGVLIVAAAGNDADENSVNTGNGDLDKEPRYPICSDDRDNKVLGVSAVNSDGIRSRFANFGSNCVDLVAPGEGIFTTAVYRRDLEEFQRPYRGYWSGTSVAAPLVAGVAALVKAVNPRLTAAGIMDVLKNTALPIDHLNAQYRGRLGAGMVDAQRAVEVALAVVQSPPPEVRAAVAVRRDRLLALPVDGGPQVLNMAFRVDGQGEVRDQWFAGSSKQRADWSVAAGDFASDRPGLELAVGAGAGQRPLISLYSQSGELIRQFAAGKASSRSGVRMASADLDGDGQDELLVVPAVGRGALLQVFSGQGKLLKQWTVFGSAANGGYSIAARRSSEQVVIAVSATSWPNRGATATAVRLFDDTGKRLAEFTPYGRSYRHGVELAVAPLGAGGALQVVTVQGRAARPEVKLFSSKGDLVNRWFGEVFPGENGWSIAIGRFSELLGSQPLIALSPLRGTTSVTTYTLQGSLLTRSKLWPESFRGGARVVRLP